MKNLTPNEFNSLDPDTKRKYTYNLFLDVNNSQEIENLFEQDTKFTRELLSIALLSSIVTENKIYFNAIFDYCANNGISLQDQAKSLLNVALRKEAWQFADDIDRTFNIIEKDIKEKTTLILDNDGRFESSSRREKLRASSHRFEPLLEFHENVLIHQLEADNVSGVDYIIEKAESKKISFEKSLIENEFINRVIEDDARSLSIMLNNSVFSKTIKESSKIQFFLFNKKEQGAVKAKLEEIIGVVDLKNSLENAAKYKMQASIDKFYNANEDTRIKMFYEICSDVESLTKLKKMFLLKTKERLDTETLLAGMIGSIENDNVEGFKLIENFIENNNIKFNGNNGSIYSQHIRDAYNCALMLDKADFREKIEKKYNVLQNQAKKEGYVCIDKDTGRCEYYGSTGSDGSYKTLDLSHYEKNTVQFCIINNIDMPFKLAQEKKLHIEPSLIEETFINACQSIKKNGNEKVVSYMLNQPYLKAILDTSSIVNLYLNEKTENIENKNKVLHLKNVIDMKNKLSVSLEEKNNALHSNKI